MLKRTVSFLLLVFMLTNLVAPLFVQAGKKEFCELSEVGSDKSEKEGKTAKEIEKDAFGFFLHHHGDFFDQNFEEKGRKPIFPKDERFISELFADSPERPPEI